MDKLSKAREKIDEIDKQIAELWVERMNAVAMVGEYKRLNGIPVLDTVRETALLENNLEYVPKYLRNYYREFQKAVVGVSKRYQNDLYSKNNDFIRLDLGDRSYNICVERGALSRAGEIMNLRRKVLVVTDNGVPAQYAQTVADQCSEPYIVTLQQGERTKCLESFRALLKTMLENRFTRRDCVVAVGGGVIGDLAGFVASAYMRGVDFYNIPTTTLAQIDSSIGGKVAIDLDGYKNTVGAFWQPKFVLIDPDVLKTLDRRLVASGLSEAVKMALCFDEKLFEIFEQGNVDSNIDEIIRRSLTIKKSVVELDEKESGLRKVLNFGHTVGHGIESAEKGYLYHGECVALGMLPMCSNEVRNRLIPVLKSLGLPTHITADPNQIKSAMLHDKKSGNGGITVVKVIEVGSFVLEETTFDSLFVDFDKYLKEAEI